jgi:hypothetical protein
MLPPTEIIPDIMVDRSEQVTPPAQGIPDVLLDHGEDRADRQQHQLAYSKMSSTMKFLILKYRCVLALSMALLVFLQLIYIVVTHLTQGSTTESTLQNIYLLLNQTVGLSQALNETSGFGTFVRTFASGSFPSDTLK